MDDLHSMALDRLAHCGHHHTSARKWFGQSSMSSIQLPTIVCQVTQVRRELRHDAQELSIRVTFAPQGIGDRSTRDIGREQLR